jgi:ComF family protein
MVRSAFHRASRVAAILGRAAGERTLDLLAPPRCAACGDDVRSRAVFCPPCAHTVERTHRRSDDRAGDHAPFLYGGALARAIVACKYGDRPDLARSLAHLLLTERDELHAQGFTCAVPVPLHAARLAERGYNVPALLLAPLARALSIPLVTRSIERVRATAQQVSLPREARWENVVGAFTVRPRGGRVLAGARVLLLDDVYTTGATLSACAEALHQGGAAVVVTRALALSDDCNDVT